MKSYFLNGKCVDKKPKNAKLVKVINSEYYETDDYSRQQSINARKFFERQREMREELEQRHG